MHLGSDTDTGKIHEKGSISPVWTTGRDSLAERNPPKVIIIQKIPESDRENIAGSGFKDCGASVAGPVTSLEASQRAPGIDR